MEIRKSIARVILILRRIALILVATLLLDCSASSAEKQVVRPAEIKCLVETRGGEKSCWGIVIQLVRGRFNPIVSAEEIRLLDSKYARNLVPFMEWTVSLDGKQLTIKFKQGFGDFGSGNTANIWIARSAFKQPPSRLRDSADWSIDTDLKDKK